MIASFQAGATGGSDPSRSAESGPERAGDSSARSGGALADIANLAVAFPDGPRSWRRVVDGAGLSVDAGEAVGLVGESGSGKTLTALALLRLVPEPGRIIGGSVRVDGVDVLAAGEDALQRLRGGTVGLVFQEPAQALNPVRSVAAQVGEAARLRGRAPNASAVLVDRLLGEVGLDAGSMRRAFPHQLSGGQRQRVLIAAALSGGPRLLVADEPTAALDGVAREEILDLLGRLRRERGLGLLLISHDLGAVARATARITVMYAGETVESGPSPELLRSPLHPYTSGLLASRSNANASGERWHAIPGRPPRPAEWGPGCRFAPRCPHVFDRCRAARPALAAADGDRTVRCFLHAAAAQGDG